MQFHLIAARQYIHEGCWLNARHALRAALPLALPSQRGHILRALKACKLALAQTQAEWIDTGWCDRD